jgi:hypothetical protein
MNFDLFNISFVESQSEAVFAFSPRFYAARIKEMLETQ